MIFSFPHGKHEFDIQQQQHTFLLLFFAVRFSVFGVAISRREKRERERLALTKKLPSSATSSSIVRFFTRKQVLSMAENICLPLRSFTLLIKFLRLHRSLLRNSLRSRKKNCASTPHVYFAREPI